MNAMFWPFFSCSSFRILEISNGCALPCVFGLSFTKLITICHMKHHIRMIGLFRQALSFFDLTPEDTDDVIMFKVFGVSLSSLPIIGNRMCNLVSCIERVSMAVPWQWKMGRLI